ncbi:MAG: response regulator transcription factor [Bacteroidota bacterium]
MNIRILLIEDQPIYVDGLTTAIQADENLEVVGTAGNGQEALDFLARREVDVAMLDVNMPVMNGLEAAPLILERYPHVEIIMLTVYNDTAMIMKFLDLNVGGYVLKDSRSKEIREAIHTVHKGGTYYGIEVMKTITAAMRNKRNSQKTMNLSPREYEILKLVIKEYTTQEIAQKLFISKETVDTHRKNIRDKMGVRNTAGMVREALRKGWITEIDL